MSASLMRNTLFYAFFSFMLVDVTKAVLQEGGQQQTNPQSSAGQHQSIAGSSGTFNHVTPLEKVHLASQTRFIRTANHGETRYFGLNEAEANSNARNRINSISRQNKGWKSTAEDVEKRINYLKNRMRQKQTNEVILGPTYGSHLQTKNNRLRSHFTAENHILQSKSQLAKPINKPTLLRTNRVTVSIDHPNLLHQHKITQSQRSAFQKVQPKNNPSGLLISQTRSSSSNDNTAGSQDEQMAKHFGGWKVPSRKHEKLSQINPSFTEITPRILPLTYSDQEILWKRLSDEKDEMMIVIKRGDDNLSPPHSLVRHGSGESIDTLADDFEKKLSISPPRHQFVRQKSISLPNSPRRSGLPPRSPNRSAASSPKIANEPFSGRRKTSSKLSNESHEPAIVSKQGNLQKRKGFSCTCSRPNGRCGC